jgi:hypothetical protein
MCRRHPLQDHGARMKELQQKVWSMIATGLAIHYLFDSKFIILGKLNIQGKYG